MLRSRRRWLVLLLSSLLSSTRISLLSGSSRKLTFQSSAADRTFTLFGFIDLVYRDAQGRLRIRDHKTGQKPWTRAEANNSNQLMFYSAATLQTKQEVPMAEISFMNVKDYVHKAPSLRPNVCISNCHLYQNELLNYLSTTLHLIEQMISSEPVPHYGRQCNWCPFLVTMYVLDRKGIDSS